MAPLSFSPLPRKSSEYCSLLTIYPQVLFSHFPLNLFQSELQPNHATESAPQNARSIVNQFSNIPLSWRLSPPWFNFFTWLPKHYTHVTLLLPWLLLFCILIIGGKTALVLSTWPLPIISSLSVLQ